MAGHEPYVCTLDEFTQKKAFDELNEDPKNRQGAIDTFRTWILQQKHFKCPTDNEFLLAFLRTRYFSQLEARKLLENFLKRRTKLSSWYQDMDLGTPEMIEIIKAKCCLILPKRDKEGRKIFFFRPACLFDVKNFSKRDSIRLFCAMMDYIYLMDEMTHVHGTVVILDFSRHKMAFELAVPIEDRKNIMQTWQANFPARIKAFHFYNAGTFLDIIMAFAKVAMTEKIQKRLIVHGKNLENVYKYVPQELLPDEYLDDSYDGPSAGSEQSIIDSMIAEFSKPEVRERMRYLSSKEFTIDMKEKDMDIPQASFRKLNVD